MLGNGTSNQAYYKAKLFRGLSDPSRLAILEALRESSRTVGELVEITGLSQSNTSNHLSCLADCGLIKRTPKGKFAEYSLSDARVEKLIQVAEELLAEVALGVFECTRYTPKEAE